MYIITYITYIDDSFERKHEIRINICQFFDFIANLLNW